MQGARKALLKGWARASPKALSKGLLRDAKRPTTTQSIDH